MNGKAHAKINICLDVLGRRSDGYHEVNMIMQELSLCDDIELVNAPAGSIFLEIDDRRSGHGNDYGNRENSDQSVNTSEGIQYVPTDMRNLMCRAAAAMIEHFNIKSGVAMKLTKRIPAAAGLGGGSSDAAAVIRLMNSLFGLNASAEELVNIGKSIGADVPYCIFGGTAIAAGIGEKLTPVESWLHTRVLLVKPQQGASTKEIYTAFDSIPAEEVLHPDIDTAVSMLGAADLKGLCPAMENVLEPVTSALLPEISEIEHYMEEHGAVKAMMSGSGPTVFGFFESEERMKACAGKIRTECPAASFAEIICTGF